VRPGAHSIGFGPTGKAVCGIAKEGRKYGVFLGLITQRAAELDATIISQCSTLFAMRMANERDQNVIRANSIYGNVAGGIALGTGALAAGMSSRFTRPLLDRILPDPGQGPSEKVQRTGHFRLQIDGTTTTGARYTAVVAADGDPGYAATSTLICRGLESSRSGSRMVSTPFLYSAATFAVSTVGGSENVRLNVPRLVKPTSRQMSVTLRSVCTSRNIARSTRRRWR